MTTQRSVYATNIGTFAAVCRHCDRSKSQHSDGHCLFDSTFWDPLTQDEWWSRINAASEYEVLRIKKAQDRLEKALPKK